MDNIKDENLNNIAGGFKVHSEERGQRHYSTINVTPDGYNALVKAGIIKDGDKEIRTDDVLKLTENIDKCFEDQGFSVSYDRHKTVPYEYPFVDVVIDKK